MKHLTMKTPKTNRFAIEETEEVQKNKQRIESITALSEEIVQLVASKNVTLLIAECAISKAEKTIREKVIVTL